MREYRLKRKREETATHIGIREAEDWFRPIDLVRDSPLVSMEVPLRTALQVRIKPLGSMQPKPGSFLARRRNGLQLKPGQSFELVTDHREGCTSVRQYMYHPGQSTLWLSGDA
ncbi:hypothetical protein TNCV_165471 [Trichonephila clavipes]|nr:hypothetical protein TNCV_165471 [Trichonephila clavipes]